MTFNKMFNEWKPLTMNVFMLKPLSIKKVFIKSSDFVSLIVEKVFMKFLAILSFAFGVKSMKK